MDTLELPHTERVPFHDPDIGVEGTPVEFRLIYQGYLPAEGSGGGHVREKHDIRIKFHRQLKLLWNDHPALRRWETHKTENSRTFADVFADKYQVGGKRFLPLISESGGLACHLHILFLRRDQPGGLVISGGDIDNRIKTLLDAMQIPRYDSQIPKGWTPAEEENPLYCVLEDDKLINDLSVTTDRLITPKESVGSVHDVHLVVHVKTLITDMNRAYIELI